MVPSRYHANQWLCYQLKSVIIITTPERSSPSATELQVTKWLYSNTSGVHVTESEKHLLNVQSVTVSIVKCIEEERLLLNLINWKTEERRENAATLRKGSSPPPSPPNNQQSSAAARCRWPHTTALCCWTTPPLYAAEQRRCPHAGTQHH